MDDTSQIKQAEKPIVNENNIDYWDNWCLETNKGRQVWHFNKPDNLNLEDLSNAFKYDKKSNPNSRDKVYRSKAIEKNYIPLPPNNIKTPEYIKGDVAKSAFKAATKGINFYQALQTDSGNWTGDYGGPMFLLPGLVIASYVTETPFPDAHQELMKRYMLNHQNDDGGWGLHIEGKSSMFGTVMQYVALRLLGKEATDKEMMIACKWIKQHGGAIGIPPWGKFYLSVLGVYNWQGNNSLMPEMWLLPKSLSMHPSRYWCHSRMVYLPMSYCYGHKVTGTITPLVNDLRSEIYVEDYNLINWSANRDTISKTDVFSKPSRFLNVLNRMVINPYEKVFNKTIRKKSLSFILDYINAEDEQTNYVDIGPVNQIINSICTWHAYGKDSPQFKKHVDRWGDYLWVAEDGMKMNGYNGSQLWDTAFAAQAIMEGGLEVYFPEVIEKAYNYIDISQVQEDVPNHKQFFRHASKGGWPFSTLDHGWPISDCTAEGLSATLKAHHSTVFNQKGSIKRITDNRLNDAVNLILTLQNADGGWATYENTRSKSWIEKLNPSGIFGDIMIDYSYTECTSACVRALCEFQADYPEYKANELKIAINNGVDFIKSKQRPDGSWYGSWAVCFTYATWFGVEGLIAAGEADYDTNTDYASKPIKKACESLLSKQNEDGGWGESFESCVEKRYVPSKKSQVVNTSWALLTLMAANYPDKTTIEKGIQFLIQKQHENGDWAQENISGVFNANCMITYTAYRNVFPLWALSRYFSKYKSF